LADTLKIEVGETASVPVVLVGKYDQGLGFTDGATASSDSPTVAVATMSGAAVDVSGSAPGTATVSIGTAELSTSFPVEVAAPKAARVEALVAAATFRRTV
jgi:hypothetical protein